MSEEPKVEGRSITEELSKLGKQMADAIKAAWESDDRKKLQAEILDGLQKFGDEVTVALDKAGKSETAQDLRVKAEKVATDVRGRVAEDVRKGIISGLDVINEELGKARWGGRGKRRAHTAPPAPKSRPRRRGCRARSRACALPWRLRAARPQAFRSSHSAT